MSNSQFTKYQVDHLFLLIGENPLPNYVAARLLLKQGGTPYLVYTTGTERPAERLRRILDGEPTGLQKAQLVSLEEYESDAYQIQTRIQKAVKELNGQVGLNYTGGTKAMAVHAYRAIFKEKGQEAVFSYLDPRRLEMCIDREEGGSCTIPIRAGNVTVSLGTLFELHGLNWRDDEQPTKDPILFNLATQLAKVYEDSDTTKSKAWSEWLKGISSSQNESLPTVGLPEEIVEGFNREGLLDKNRSISWEFIKGQNIFSNFKEFCTWLQGKWLEHYLLGQVKWLAHKLAHKDDISKPNQICISDYGLGFKVPLEGTVDGFEFDLAFTCGYQLFAISCTTKKTRSDCKLKLFEAYLRSQQLGGSEARVALFCFNDDLGSLTSEMGNLLSQKQIRLFGRKHLANFNDEVVSWIRDNDTEAGR